MDSRLSSVICILCFGFISTVIAIEYGLDPNTFRKFKLIRGQSEGVVARQSVSFRKAIESHLGVKFWETLYGSATQNEILARELTAENCEACALEEAQERVAAAKDNENLNEELKKDIALLNQVKAAQVEEKETSESAIDSKRTDNAFKFVTKLFETLFSPLSLLSKGKGKSGGATSKNFPQLQGLLLVNRRPGINGLAFIRNSAFAGEIGQLGVKVCQLTNSDSTAAAAMPSLPQSTYRGIRNFCHSNQKTLNLVDALDQFSLE